MKRGVTFDVENFGEKYKIELVCDSYLDNGSLYVGAYDVTPESDNFGERWADISVNLNNPCQNDRTVFLDMNNLYNPGNHRGYLWARNRGRHRLPFRFLLLSGIHV